MLRTGLVLVALVLTAGADDVGALRQRAATARERGKTGDAAHLLEQALSLEPDSEPVLLELLDLNADDPEGFAHWAWQLALARCDAQGRYHRPKGVTPDRYRRLEPALRRTAERAAFVAHLAGLADELHDPDRAHFAFFLRDLARPLISDSPALQREQGDAFESAVERCRPGPREILRPLQRRMLELHRSGKTPEALPAARILLGIANQAARGGCTGFEKSRAEAIRIVEAIDGRRRRDQEPLRESALRKIPRSDRPGFEALHSEWTDPIVTLSPADRYRIESGCGVRATLMATADVEYQHARLVDWFGRDPFLDRQGTVRLVHTQHDFETEGQPFFWAGGFQGGDLTVLRLSFADRMAIAGGLTHELTHRFDGKLYPGLPGWLVEGRACYTGGGTLWPRSGKVEPRAVGWGAFHSALYHGYQGREKLEEMLRGKTRDYRHTYFVGYSLWMYLYRRHADEFAARIEPYMRSCAQKPRLDPIERFESYFADGQGGRPEGLDDFVAGFRRFLEQAWEAEHPCAWKRDWIRQHEEAVKQARDERRAALRSGDGFELSDPDDADIFDRNNFHPHRNQSRDPEVGEGQAFRAALWLAEQGREDAARVAGVWSRYVDEPTRDRLLRLAELEDPLDAWLLALAAGEPASPVPSEMKRTHQRLHAFIDALLEEEMRARLEGRPRLLHALQAERERIARRAGLKVAFKQIAPDEGARCPPFVSLLNEPLTNEVWCPSESRIGNAWHVASPSLLILGHKESEPPVSGYVRDAGLRELFVRSDRFWEASYTFRSKVRLISAHLHAAVVVGHTRDDRGLVVEFSGGDFDYAIGKKKEGEGFRSIRLRLNDLRAWDPHTRSMGNEVRFRAPRQSFRLAIHVCGAFVRVEVDGEEILAHRTALSTPVRGRVGFYLGSGVVGFQEPEVRRHRALGPERTCQCGHGDEPLDLRGGNPSLDWSRWQGRRVIGLEPDPLGRLVLCYAPPHREGWTDGEAVREALALWEQKLGHESAVDRLSVLFPAGSGTAWSLHLPAARLLPCQAIPGLAPALERWLAQRGDAEEHHRQRIDTRPAWFTIDPQGAVRAQGVWPPEHGGGPDARLLRSLRGW